MNSASSNPKPVYKVGLIARAHNCPSCDSDNVGYQTEYAGNRDLHYVVCFTCGREGAVGSPLINAINLWNQGLSREEQP